MLGPYNEFVITQNFSDETDRGRLWTSRRRPRRWERRHDVRSESFEFCLKQRNQIGGFWKFFMTIFFTKVGQMYGRLFGIFWKHQFEVKTDVATFLGNLLKNWATFNFGIWSHWSQVNQVPFYLENSKLTLSVWVVAKYPWSSLVEGDEQPVRANCQTQMNDAVHVDISKFLVCYKHSSLPHGQFLLFISVY